MASDDSPGVDHASTPNPERDELRRAITELIRAMSVAFRNGPDEAYFEILHGAEAAWLAGSSTERPLPARRGGLSPWQARALSNYIDCHLESQLTTVELASVAQLSMFHFCRAFRESFGQPPHAYVMRRRIERAQGLMLRTAMPLAQIAIECGMADQAHLNKSFRRIVGQSPGEWRRARET